MRASSFFVLALLIVGIATFIRHFGGFALRWWRARRVAGVHAAEQQRVTMLLRDAEGGPDRPHVVTSTAVIEVRAVKSPCVRCGSRVRVEDHRAMPEAGRRRRVVTTVCVHCGFRRELWFELGEAEN
jgi:hypothetical protein